MLNSKSQDDILQQEHEEYIKLINESGVPLWILDYYWY